MGANKDFIVKNGATITQDLSVGGNAYLNALTGTNATFTSLTSTSATFVNTVVTSTSALSVINNGTGPALYVRQKGSNQPIAEFVDQEGGVIYFADTGNLGINTTDPNEKLTISGNVSATCNLSALRVAVCNTSYGGFISGGRDLADIFATTAGAGTIDGSGTANYLAKWSDSDTITNSIARESSTQLTVAGKLSATGALSAEHIAACNSSYGGFISGGRDLVDIFTGGCCTGTIDGSGTTCHVPYFSDANTIASSCTYFNSSTLVNRGTISGSNICSHNDICARGDLTTIGNISAGGVLSAKEAIRVPDNAYVALGNSDDLKIKHTGSESQIFNNTGQLDIRTPSRLLVTSSGGDEMIRAEVDGSVCLYYDDSAKLCTTNTGVNITGGLSAGGLSACNTRNGIVSAGRDLADIFVTTSGNVDGSGTANFLPSWSDSDTLTDSLLSGGTNMTRTTGSLSATTNMLVGGNIGVGTCAPNEKLTVSGNISSTGNLSANGNISLTEDQRIYFEADKATWIETDSADRLRFVAGGKQMLLLDQDTGDRAVFGFGTGVGINIGNNSLPNEKLTVAGNISATGTLSAERVAACNSSYGGFISGGRDLADIFATSSGNIDGSGTANFLPVFSDSNTIGDSIAYQTSTQITVAGNVSAYGGLSASRAPIYFACRVGIGTSAPEAPLHVNSTGGTLAQFHRSGTQLVTIGGSSNKGQIRFQYGSDCISTGATTGGDYSIDTGGSVGAGDNMFYVCKGGNVGVGTTAPNEKLTVSGNVSSLGGLSGGTLGQASFLSGNLGIGTNRPTSFLHVSANKCIPKDLVVIKGGGSVGDYDGLKIEAGNGTDLFRVNQLTYNVLMPSSGKVGIGNTAPNEKLTVSGNVSACGGLSATEMNSYFGCSVGIGTTTPEEKLTVSGNISACGGLSATGSDNYFSGDVGIGCNRPIYGRVHVTQGANDSSSGIAVVNTGNGRSLRLWANSSNVGRIDGGGDGSGDISVNGAGSGNVAIGGSTVGVDQKLTVHGNISALGSLSAGLGEHFAACNSSYGGFISGGRDLADIFATSAGNIDGSGTTCHVPYFSDANTIASSCTYFNSAMLTNRGAISGSAFCTDGNGYFACVGIGTTTPNQKLTVAGNISACGGLSATKMNSYFGCNVGIGISTPTADLHIKDASGDPTQILLEDASGGTQTAKIVFDQTAQNSLVLSTQYQSSTDLNLIQFAPADNVAMTIRGGTGSNDGNVGIGNTAPNSKLTVTGNVSATGTLSANNIYTQKLYDYSLPNSYYLDPSSTSRLNVLCLAGYACFSELRASTLTVKGNISACGGLSATEMNSYFGCSVGIGTATPARKLNVVGDAEVSTNLVVGTALYTNDWTAGTSGIQYIKNSSGSTSIAIENGGNVGIGTATPNEKLTVAGNISADGNMYVSAQDPFIHMTDDSGSTYSAAWKFQNNCQFWEWGGGKKIYFDEESGIRFGDWGAGTGTLATTRDPRIGKCGTTYGGLCFTTGNSTRMVIQSAGNVGIGTATPNEKLTVAGNISATGCLLLPDAGQIRLGNTGDLVIQHDGANSYITEQGTGDLYIQPNSSALYVRDAVTGNVMIAAKAGSGRIAELYAGGNVILRTAGAGIDVFGTVTASRGLTAHDGLSARSTRNGIVSAGRDLADIFATSSGNVDGTGTKFKIPQWNDTDTLGDSPLSAVNDGISVAATKKIYLNKTEDTYIDSDSTDRLRAVAGGQQMLVLDYDTGNRAAFGDTKVAIGGGDNAMPDQALTVAGNISACGGLSATKGVGYFACNVGIGTNAPDYPLHVVAPATASTSELIAQFQVSDDASSYVGIGNNTSGNNKLDPTVIGYNYCSNSIGVSLLGGLRADTTSAPAVNIQGKIGGHATGSAVADTTKLVCFTNYGTNPTVVMGSGNWGLGTTSPGQKLTVAGNISACGNLSATGAGYNYFVGCVGIGTATPTEKLEVTGNIRLKGSSNHRLQITNDSNNNWGEIGNDGTSGENTLEFFTKSSSVPAMSITNADNVGIGETAPNQKLTVSGNISALGSLSAGLGEHVAVCNSSYGGFISGGRDLADIFETCSGSVDGSGTANYIAQWSDTDTLTNSLLSGGTSMVTVNGAFSAQQYCSVGSNTIFGTQALNATSGGQNTAIGLQAMLANTTGYQNVAVGEAALAGNTEGLRNVGVGCGAAYATSTGDENVAIGYEAFKCNTINDCNTAVGSKALFSSSGGVGNAAVGQMSMYNNTGGSDNVAVGRAAMHKNTTGCCNTAVGAYALCVNRTGCWNTAIGNYALRSNDVGEYNVGLGYRTLYSNTSGDYGIAIGRQALDGNTTGNMNIAIGRQAMYVNTTGACNSVLGTYGLNCNTTGSYNQGLGHSALYCNTVGAYNNAMGYCALHGSLSGNHNNAIGFGALHQNYGGSGNEAIGREALRNNRYGSCNQAIGYRAMYSNTTGCYNVGIGCCALATNTTANNNVAVGCGALMANTTGFCNTAIGRSAMVSNTEGCCNVALGTGSLNGNTTSCRNIAVGARALLSNTIGDENVAIGNNSLQANVSASYSVAIGANALCSSRCQGLNTAVGYDSLKVAISASNNTALGFRTLCKTWGSNNTAIGGNALRNTTGGCYNDALGINAMYNNAGGCQNTALGNHSLYSNTAGNNNVAAGQYALKANTTGNFNAGIGLYAGCNNITGDCNVFAGYAAGRYLANGSSSLCAPENGTYIGTCTRGNTDTENNAIVIGFCACSCGSNTVSIGNKNITNTYITGTLSASGNLSAAQGYHVSVTNNSTGGFISGGRDLAGIFATSAGNIDGSGTTCHVPYFSDANTIASSCAYFNSSMLTNRGAISGSAFCTDGDVCAAGNGYFACVIAGGYFEQKAANDILASYPTGTIVVIGCTGDLVQSTRKNDRKVFGVTQSGVCQPIVLGAEPVLVTGDIRIGDYITTSDKPGHGTRTHEPIHGAVIAQSMEAGTGDSHLVNAMIRKM